MAVDLPEAVRRLDKRAGVNRMREMAVIIGRSVLYDIDKVRRYRRPIDAPVEYRSYVQALRRDGYVLIPEYRPRDICLGWARQILEAIPEPPPAHGDSEPGSYMVYAGSRKAELPNGGIVEWRNADGEDGKDRGILCVYHADREFPEFAGLRDDPMVASIIAATCGRKLPSRAFKAFVNDSVAQTSDYHVDQTSTDQFKTFLFLSDVVEPSDGAHSYVPGTHMPTLARYLNYGKNMFDAQRYEYDMTAVSTRQPVDLLCPAGTLAIVDITGSHRALPQTSGRRRIMLNNCYDEFTYD
jgi:hypothetical protein